MDYLLSVFFNSETSDPKLSKDKFSTTFPELAGLDDYQYYGPWKWHWRQSQKPGQPPGPRFFETGNQRHAALSEEAALGKLTLRVWNRETSVKAMLRAEVLVRISGQDEDPKVNSIFSAFKYEDAQGTNLVSFDDSYVDCYRAVLRDVPGGRESDADYGDQIMRSWDVGEFYFSLCPRKKYNFEVGLWVEFEQPERRIFVIDPEMDVGLAPTAID